jgi:UDP-3-O-[3-hydroxymyristoyl] glucosamine N-acyltransferase
VPIRLRATTPRALAAELGGTVSPSRADAPITRIAPPALAGEGDLAPLLSRRFWDDAMAARARGAVLLVDARLAKSARATSDIATTLGRGALDWVHDHPTWAMACVLDRAIVADEAPILGEGATIAPSAVIGPRVTIGARVTVGPGAVIGHPGFGFVEGPRAEARAIPQLGGVVIEDDVSIGPLTTIDAGTLSPTIVRRGAKLDAHVHVGHNADVGEGAILCAQVGLAGSVVIGRGAVLGGQAGVADHCVVGAGAKIAAKSGVIGDVPNGATYAGYPAIERMRWLRGLARAFKI